MATSSIGLPSTYLTFFFLVCFSARYATAIPTGNTGTNEIVVASTSTSMGTSTPTKHLNHQESPAVTHWPCFRCLIPPQYISLLITHTSSSTPVIAHTRVATIPSTTGSSETDNHDALVQVVSGCTDCVLLRLSDTEARSQVPASNTTSLVTRVPGRLLHTESHNDIISSITTTTITGAGASMSMKVAAPTTRIISHRRGRPNIPTPPGNNDGLVSLSRPTTTTQTTITIPTPHRRGLEYGPPGIDGCFLQSMSCMSSLPETSTNTLSYTHRQIISFGLPFSYASPVPTSTTTHWGYTTPIIPTWVKSTTTTTKALHTTSTPGLSNPFVVNCWFFGFCPPEVPELATVSPRAARMGRAVATAAPTSAPVEELNTVVAAVAPTTTVTSTKLHIRHRRSPTPMPYVVEHGPFRNTSSIALNNGTNENNKLQHNVTTFTSTNASASALRGIGGVEVVNRCPFDVFSNIVHAMTSGRNGTRPDSQSVLGKHVQYGRDRGNRTARKGGSLRHRFTHDPNLGVSWKLSHVNDNGGPVQFEWTWTPEQKRVYWDLSLIDTVSQTKRSLIQPRDPKPTPIPPTSALGHNITFPPIPFPYEPNPWSGQNPFFPHGLSVIPIITGTKTTKAANLGNCRPVICPKGEGYCENAYASPTDWSAQRDCDEYVVLKLVLCA